MKFWKHTLVTAFAFIGISSTVLYTSCQQDSCLDLQCKNGGSCAEGFCRCTTGFEGTQCDVRANTKFLGFYQGYSRCSNEPAFIDSVVINAEKQPNRVSIHKFSTNQTYQGTVKDNVITIDEIYAQGRILTVIVENKQLTYFEQTVPTDTLSACNFEGTRRN